MRCKASNANNYAYLSTAARHALAIFGCRHRLVRKLHANRMLWGLTCFTATKWNHKCQLPPRDSFLCSFHKINYTIRNNASATRFVRMRKILDPSSGKRHSEQCKCIKLGWKSDTMIFTILCKPSSYYQITFAVFTRYSERQTPQIAHNKWNNADPEQK